MDLRQSEGTSGDLRELGTVPGESSEDLVSVTVYSNNTPIVDEII